MENYQKKLDRTLEALEGSRPGLLLHSCCGPCSSYVLEYLSRHFRLGLLYYDPNIQPEAEYELRLENQRRVLEHYPDIALHEYGWRGAEYEAAVRGLEAEPEGGARCTVCFRLRLEETARLAKELGYEYFCTTLSVSPHKDAGAAQPHRHGACGEIRREMAALGLQEARGLQAEHRAFEGIRAVPAGLLRLPVLEAGGEIS